MKGSRGEKMKMCSRVILCIFVFVLTLGLGPSVYAQYGTPEKSAEKQAEKAVQAPPGYKLLPEDLTANVNTTFYSKYLWRGLELSKDSLVIFPSITVGYKGFAANVWLDLDTNFNNSPPGKEKEFKLQETDLTLTYTNKFRPLKLDYTFGWIYYDTDGFDGETPSHNQELFATLALDLPLKPTFSTYLEIETGTAWYFTFALSHGFKVYKDWSLDVGGWVSYFYNKTADRGSPDRMTGMHDGNLWTGLTIPLGKYFSVQPKLQYSFPLSSASSDRIKANSFDGDDDRWLYGGVIVDFKF